MIDFTIPSAITVVISVIEQIANVFVSMCACALWINMFCIMYTTIDDMTEALSISRTLVEEKLVACTNIIPITSVFNWDGMQTDDEFGIIMKTMEDLTEAATSRLKELHPYELPCIIWLPIDGSYEYLEWIQESLE